MTLLVRLRDAGDQVAWRQLVAIYAPVIYAYARHHGLQQADAEDLVQDVLGGVAAARSQLDAVAEQGSFRQWLFTVAHHKLFDLRRRQQRPGQGTGDSDVRELLEQHPSTNENQAAWDLQYEQRLFIWAAEQQRPHFEDRTWQAFWQTAVEGKVPADVASELGMTVASVYLAKSRVTAKLREQIQAIEGSES